VFYARSGDVSITHQVVGDQPVDLVFVRGFVGDLLAVWEQPLLVHFIDALTDFARVIMIDKRGTGLSDRVREVPTLETRMDDLRAVMDDAGSESAILSTAQEQEGARLARGSSRTCGVASVRGSALAFFRMMIDSEVSHVLPAVRLPTVVLSRASEHGPSQYFARRIAGAKLVELPNLRSIYHWVDDDAHEIALRETRRLAAAAHGGPSSERCWRRCSSRISSAPLSGQHCSTHRRTRGLDRDRRRGPRLLNGERPRGGVGNRVRGERRAHPQRGPRRLAAVRRQGSLGAQVVPRPDPGRRLRDL
jgi:hypothetical protein